MKPVAVFARDDVERFRERVIAVIARADCDVGRIAFDHGGEAPDRHFAEAFGRGEEIPIAEHPLAHGGVSDVVGREREEIELEARGAFGQRRGRHIDQLGAAQVLLADMKFAHDRLRFAVPTRLCARRRYSAGGTLGANDVGDGAIGLLDIHRGECGCRLTVCVEDEESRQIQLQRVAAEGVVSRHIGA